MTHGRFVIIPAPTCWDHWLTASRFLLGKTFTLRPIPQLTMAPTLPSLSWCSLVSFLLCFSATPKISTVRMGLVLSLWSTQHGSQSSLGFIRLSGRSLTSSSYSQCSGHPTGLPLTSSMHSTDLTSTLVLSLSTTFCTGLLRFGEP